MNNVGVNVGGQGFNLIDSVSSPYSLNGQFPPEIAVKEQALNRKQQMAQLLMQKGLQPRQGQMVGRFYVPPGLGQELGGLGETIAGALLSRRNDQGRAALADESQRYTSDAIKQWQAARNGTPAQPAVPAQPGAPVPTYEGQQIDLGGMVNIPGKGAAFLNSSGAQPVTPADPNGYARAMKQQQAYTNGALGENFSPESQPDAGFAAELSQRVNGGAQAAYPTPQPQAPANPNMADIISMRPGPEIPGRPAQSAIPATPEQRQAADMAFASKHIPGGMAMLQMQGHHEDQQQQREQHAKEFDQTTAIRQDDLKARHEEVRLLREQRDNEFQGRMDDRQATREQRDREITQRLQDSRTTHEEKIALEKDRMKMQDEQKRDQMKMEERMRERDDRTRREMNAANNETRLQVSNNSKGDGVKLKPGERMRPDGTVEAIQGSDLYQKQGSAHAKDYGSLQTMNTKTQMALDKIDSVLSDENKGAFNSNFGGYNAKFGTQYLPGAQDVRNKIDSIKSDLKTAGLEIIRAGGGIGQMTEREWPIVEKMIDSIDPTLSESAAREAFGKIKAYMGKIRDNAQSTYDTEWGNSQFYKGGQAAPPPPGNGKVLRFDAQGNQIQ